MGIIKKIKRKTAPLNYDPVIMRELLDQPSVKKYVTNMEKRTLDWYKVLLVQEGVYAAYVKERKQIIKDRQKGEL